MQHKIVVRFGEFTTLFYVVEYNPDDETDWEVIHTAASRASAEKYLESLD